MANIIPFKGIRPVRDKAHLVASRSVDNYKQDELAQKLSSNPYTFLHVINPDHADKKGTVPGSKERLQKIKSRFIEFVNKKILARDAKPRFYVYQQIKDNNTFTGIIGCIAIDDYFNNTIKVHEQTITDREEKLMHYLEVCDFNAEPVLFCYPNDKIIDEKIAQVLLQEPVYDFSTTDKVEHKLWLLEGGAAVLVSERFKTIPAIYIADGHHRSASSALLGKSKREKLKHYSGKEAFNYYLGAFFPETQLRIYDFNRVIKDLNGLSTEDFLTKLTEKFTVEEKGNTIYKATSLHNFSMYFNEKCYSLTAKPSILSDENPVERLDASILTKHILSPILNIHDLKTDKRISFIPGVKGMEELKRQVDEGHAAAAFGLFPVTMEQLKLISDTNNIMPPKSTYVEPKMRSGLVVYSLTDEK